MSSEGSEGPGPQRAQSVNYVGTVSAGTIMVQPKNPAVSLIVSFFLPGVGSMINGNVGKGIVILIGYLLSFLLAFVLIGVPFLIGFWIWGLVDAYQGAQSWNRAHGIVS